MMLKFHSDTKYQTTDYGRDVGYTLVLVIGGIALLAFLEAFMMTDFGDKRFDYILLILSVLFLFYLILRSRLP